MTLGLKMNNVLTPQQLLEQQLRNQGLPNFGSIGGNDYGFGGMTGMGDGSGLGLTGGAGITGLSTAGLGANNFWNQGTTPGATGFGNSGGGGTGLGWNLGTAQLGVNAIGAIGGMYNALQANKLAKNQFNFTKEVTNTNLNNQIKSYNTELEGRALARGRLDGKEDPRAYADQYTEKNKLTRG